MKIFGQPARAPAARGPRNHDDCIIFYFDFNIMFLMVNKCMCFSLPSPAGVGRERIIHAPTDRRLPQRGRD